jgi:WD40-like Beta Propeller Repeat
MISAIRICVALAVAAAFAPAAQALEFSPWAPAVNAESVLGTSELLNTSVQDGCPIQSPDRLSLYMASTRPRFDGDTRTDIDIWVAERESKNAPWGAPVNLPSPVNSTADDFCPTPVRGGGLFFVSRRVMPGVTCGLGDIYLTRLNPGQGWAQPEHLGCEADGGPNTALDEQGPSYVKTGGPTLYFSSGSSTAADIYKSERHGDGSFGPPELVTSLSSSAAVDVQPNVRHDGREVVFASNRGGPTAFGGQDLWVATRAGPNGPWSTPVNIGGNVNSTANETRPSLSWDGTTLYFGRAPGLPVTADIFVTTRERVGD